MKNWNSAKLTRAEALELICKITDQDDPYWEQIVEDYYDEESDTMPSIYHILSALGVTENEYRDASGADGVVDWPK